MLWRVNQSGWLQKIDKNWVLACTHIGMQVYGSKHVYDSVNVFDKYSQNIYMMTLCKCIWQIFTLFLWKCKKFEHEKCEWFTIPQDLQIVYTNIDTHKL